MMRKLLIVDDDADLRKTIRLLFSRSYNVLEASNGRQALEVAREESPDVMLLDIGMPDMSGLETLKAIHAQAPAVPVIMLTGEKDMEVAGQALGSGSVEYITKPFDLEYLRFEIRRLMHKSTVSKKPVESPPWHIIT